jgi:hypothetical protein
MFRRSGLRFADENMRQARGFEYGAAAKAMTPSVRLALSSAAAIARMAAKAAAPPVLAD